MNIKKLLLIIAALVIVFLKPLWERSKLDPALPPGGNFDLTNYSLQLPSGNNGKMQIIPAGKLAGKAGFTNQYFYTDKVDGAMTLMVPHQGVTSPNSTHCRTELREQTQGWRSEGNHSLTGEVAVPLVQERTALAQVYQASGPRKPLCLLEYLAGGQLLLYVEKSPQGGSTTRHPVGQVDPGSKFNFVLSVSDNELNVNINGSNTTVSIPLSFSISTYYFKAGNYDQTSVAGLPQEEAATIVKYYKLNIKHE